jgi:predicted dithiol-disulfide oxidoreductase (DUF899 family)
MAGYNQTMEKLRDYRRRIEDLRVEMRKTAAQVTPEPVADYVFAGKDGPVRLSELFGDKDDLILIHNMGRACASCTLWADGFNGLYDHLADRAAFVVSSPDSPEAQQAFAASRGWRFPMVSHAGTNFARDMGYLRDDGWWPGISVFRRDGPDILRVADAELGPGDDFCSLWHLFDLMPRGPAGWEPRFSYARASVG